MRLGEGSGAILTLPIVQASAHILNEMATFEDAEVIDIKVSGETEIPDTVQTSVPPCRMLVIGGARSGKSTFAESRLPRDSPCHLCCDLPAQPWRRGVGGANPPAPSSAPGHVADCRDHRHRFSAAGRRRLPGAGGLPWGVDHSDS
ncbi:nicotinate-nucleotide-dimethylbenzimidazole phosphoribosyltransferase [Cutibacterium acnes JCM 18916]|nr:nicotinate-nucleotide-dimethylbenzimidazole phosphoribosyltransferase [Cutibacterium acnes JCM 18916]